MPKGAVARPSRLMRTRRTGGGEGKHKRDKTIFRIFNPKNNQFKPLFYYFCHDYNGGAYMALIEQLIYIPARTTLPYKK